MSRYATDARLRFSINIMPASFQGRQSIKKSKNQKRSLIPQNRSNRQLAHCILVNTHDFFLPSPGIESRTSLSTDPFAPTEPRRQSDLGSVRVE